MTKKYLPPVLVFVATVMVLSACRLGSPVPAIPPTATPDISFRRISLREFTGDNIILDVPLEFDIPQDYGVISLVDPPFLGNVSPYALSRWIPTEDIDSYKSGDPLPATSGGFYIKISNNVIYNDDTETFSGASFTDQEIKDLEAKGIFFTFQEQRQIGEFPILIVEQSSPPDDQGRTQTKYLYIETVVAETIAIIYSPSAANSQRDEYIWRKLIETLSVRK